MTTASKPTVDGAAKHGGSRMLGLIWAMPPVVAMLALFFAVPHAAQGEPLTWAVPWLPALDVELAIRLDGLALLFALLVTGIGALIMIYAASYMEGHPQRLRFLGILAAFMASMLGLVVADDLILLFVFWELTTITSFLLIGFDHETEKGRRSALQALLVTALGGLALLAGVVMLYLIAGTWRVSEIITMGAEIQDHALFLPALILILVGAFSKSAQVPLHFWLPNAMAAPTPVSAYLHSATMVKAGVFLLARLHPALAGNDVWLWTLTIFGGVTAVWASIWAVRQDDLKQTLAMTTLMALGTLVLLLANASDYAVMAAMSFLMVHAFYKAGLFLVVGIIDHETGTRDRHILSGLGRLMPLTFAAAALAGMSMAGFPPFLGFIGKELGYESALAVGSSPLLVVGALVLANALMLAVAGIVALRPFIGPQAQTPRKAHDPDITMWGPPMLLAALGLVLGLMPWLASDWIIRPAAQAVLGEPIDLYLSLWHGVNVPLMLSILTVASGIVLYRLRAPVIAALVGVERRMPLSADRAYDHALNGTIALCKKVAGIQSGHLRTDLRIIVGTVAIGVLAALLLVHNGPLSFTGSVRPTWIGVALALLVIAGTVATLFARGRIAGLTALGTVGAAIAGLFVVHGALDVAMTQLLVDILVVVLAAAVLRRLPEQSVDAVPTEKTSRAGDAVIAGAAGVGVAGALLAVLSHPFDDRITAFFQAASVPDAHGRNIVNVILVDFRALDTLGEVAVVAVSALGVWILVRTLAKGGVR